MESKPLLKFEDVEVVYKTDTLETLALTDFTLDIHENEFVCLVGSSGCGKSTALNLSAGLLFPTSGIVEMEGREVTGPDATRAVVFQGDAVFPWMKVEQNIAFGPESQGKTKQEVAELVDMYLGVTGLTEFRTAWPNSLSGGMRKRVDLARAYASDPKVLLMDEPFGALDILLKENLQHALRELWRNKRKTIFFITHDLEEALFLGDRVVVMTPRPGRIAKVVDVNFGVDRKNDLRTEPRFIEMRRELRAIMGDIEGAKS